MATVSRENIGTLHDKISVKVEKNDYFPSFDKTLKEHAKKANIPGFRKGMVPTGLIRKMYGQSAFNEEVIRAASKELEDFLRKEQISIFAQPMMMAGEHLHFDMNSPSDYEFNFEIGIKPDFEITPLVNKAQVTRYKIPVTDKIIDADIDKMKIQFGKEEPQDTISNKEQIIYLTLRQCNEEGSVIDEENIINAKSELGKLPIKLQDLLMGKKVDDTIVLKPVDICSEDELDTFLKTALEAKAEPGNFYSTKVSAIALLMPMEVGKELFDKVYPKSDIADETEFRNKIKSELEADLNRVTADRLQNDIFELLVHNTPIEFPITFLKRHLREGGENKKTEEEVEKMFPSFEHQLRWQLISEQMIHDFGIKVSKDDIIDKITHDIGLYYDIDDINNVPWIQGYKDKILKDDKVMEETYTQMMLSRLFFVLEKVLTVEEQEITEEDFMKLADAHHAHSH